VEIGGFRINKELFSTKDGLRVYKVTHPDTGESFMLRLAEFSRNAAEGGQDLWYKLYDDYQLTITNFKSLPRVSTISQLDDQRLISLLECEEGNTLKQKGKLGLNEISQLIDAVRHLHRKKMVHGSIHANNIWLTNHGRIVLYGAGEAKVLDNKISARFSTDIQQITKVIQDYSSLSEILLDKLEMERPMSIEELEMIFAEGETNEDQIKKSGLVEKEKPKQKTVTAPTPVKKVNSRPNSETKKVEPTRSPKMERHQEPNSERNKNQEDHRDNQERPNRQEHQKQRKGSWFKNVLMTVVTVLAILFVIDKFTGSEPSQEAASTTAAKETNLEQQVSTAEENNANESERQEVTLVEESEPEQQEVSVSESFTNEEVAGLVGEYLQASIDAINYRDFTMVEHLIDPNGKKYAEQRDYNKYLEEKNITEELLAYEIKDVVKVDESTFKVTTHEEYRIIYDDSSEKLKAFNSGFLVKVLANGQLAVNELIFLEDLSS
jgi:hypothetical protein